MPPLVCSDVSVSAHMQTVRWRHLTTGAIARRKSPSELASLGLRELCFYMPLYSLAMCPELKRRRGWHNLKTLVGPFTILSYVRNFLLIFFIKNCNSKFIYIRNVS